MAEPAIVWNVKGVYPAIRKFKRLGAALRLRGAMERALFRMWRGMAQYPPPRPGSAYIRGYGYPGRPTSERLGQSWNRRIVTGKDWIEARLGTNVTYAPWVQSHRFQAWMHRGRWQTDRDVLNREAKTIVRDMENTIRAAMAKGE